MKKIRAGLSKEDPLYSLYVSILNKIELDEKDSNYKIWQKYKKELDYEILGQKEIDSQT